MKIHDVRNYRGFILCRGVITKGEKVESTNRTDIGEYSQFLYLPFGSGWANAYPLKPQKLYQMVQHKDQKVTYTSDADVTAWVAFNPINSRVKLSADIVDVSKEVTYTADTDNLFFIPLAGEVTVNGKVLKDLMSGNLVPGKSAKLVVPPNAICAVISVSKADT